jgi:hypothetical protein
MSQSKIVLKVDPMRTGTDASVEQLLRQVVAGLVPHLQRQVGAIHHRQGEQSGTMWTTEGWLDDGTYVSLSIGVGSDEVALFVDTSPVLKPSKPIPSTQKIGLAIAATVATSASWWHFRSIVSILGGIVVGVVLWTTVETLFAMRKERIAAGRAVDEENWRRRLVEATVLGDVTSPPPPRL